MKNKVHLVPNLGLFIETCIAVTVMVATFIMILLLEKDWRIILIYGTLLAAALWLICINDWLTFITLTPEGISCWGLGRKTEFRPYHHYNHIYFGGYYNRSILIPHVIFTNRYLDTDQLLSVNRLAMSVDMVKLHWTKRMRKKLYEILPPDYQYKLDVATTFQKPPRKPSYRKLRKRHKRNRKK